MPWLVRVVFGEEYLPAVDAARIVLVSAAILLVLGWSKSLPVTIGRPRLRIVTHSLEAIVLLPLVVVLGDRNGVTGAAVAILVSTLVFALAWVVILVRLRDELRAARAGAERGGRVVKVVVVSGIWPPDVGGPASHAPALADALLERGHEVEVVTTADAEPAARPYPVRWVSRGTAGAAPSPRGRARGAPGRARRGSRLRDDDGAPRRARRGARAAAARRQARRRRGVRARAALGPLRRHARGVPAASAAASASERCARPDRRAPARARVVVPSAYLREIALGWGLDPSG